MKKSYSILKKCFYVLLYFFKVPIRSNLLLENGATCNDWSTSYYYSFGYRHKKIPTLLPSESKKCT